MRRLALIILGTGLLLVTACGGGSSDKATATPTSGGSVAVATATPAVDSSDGKPTPAPTPGPGEISVANEPVSVETSDGVVLKGHLYSTNGPKRQALIIVAPVEQSVWAESTQAFTSEGVAVFTFDPRGYGETGGNADTEALASDAELVARFVMSREYPLVYLMGAGMDGAAAVTQAASSVDGLSGVITYGGAGKSETANALALGGDATWSGENVLAIPQVQDKVLTFVLGGN